jgi:hypothetical protein
MSSDGTANPDASKRRPVPLPPSERRPRILRQASVPNSHARRRLQEIERANSSGSQKINHASRQSFNRSPLRQSTSRREGLPTTISSSSTMDGQDDQDTTSAPRRTTSSNKNDQKEQQKLQPPKRPLLAPILSPPPLHTLPRPQQNRALDQEQVRDFEDNEETNQRGGAQDEDGTDGVLEQFVAASPATTLSQPALQQEPERLPSPIVSSKVSSNVATHISAVAKSVNNAIIKKNQELGSTWATKRPSEKAQHDLIVDGTSLGRRQFRTIMWKNWVLKRRKWKNTLVEILSPVVVVSLI